MNIGNAMRLPDHIAAGKCISVKHAPPHDIICAELLYLGLKAMYCLRYILIPYFLLCNCCRIKKEIGIKSE